MRSPTRQAWRLGLLFGTIYFVQGVGEPTEGLIIQPVRSLLRSWGRGPGEIGAFVGAMAIPWSLKPLYGLLTDFVPLAGLRRRSYLIVASALTVLGLLGPALLPIPTGGTRWLLAWLVVATVAVAFSDVVVDALMVEEGQPRGLTGTLQAVQWGCMYAATILTGIVGGYLSAHHQERLGFLICGGLSAVTLGLAVFVVREPPRPKESASVALILRDAVRARGVLAVGGFLFLWNFNPFSNTVLHLHMTGPMGLGEQFYGNTVALMSVACIAASLTYGLYCRRVPMTWLVHASIALGVLSTLFYWALSDRRSAMMVTLAVGFTYMTATLIQLDLAARACPPRAAGTTFALLMALSNLGTSLSTWLGGDWYERGTSVWGSRMAFDVLVGVGAAFTAGCWLLVPFLPASLLGEAGQDSP
jgi:MFS family permease